jgi:fermentation-respiration switch protein FrsA (DUF1100 family)
MLHYQLPTYRYLPNVKAPVTFFHGTKDRIVVYNNSLRLKKLFKSADTLITIKGGHHNDLYQFPQTKAVLDSILTKKTPAL